MCPVALGETKRPNMDQKTFEKIVKDCEPYAEQIETFGLYMLNEPLLDRQLAERIKYAKKYGIKNTQIATNVDLLTKDRIQPLIESGLDEIILSIESIYPEKHEKIRVGSDLSKVKENFDELIRIKDRMASKSPRIYVRMLAFEKNPDSWKEYINYWQEKGADHVIIVNLHNWGGVYEQFDRPLVGINVCNYLWTMMVIQSDGNVSLCCLDPSGEYSLGNVHTESLYDIWHGEKFKAVREQFESKQLKKCLGCNWNPNEVIGMWDEKVDRLSIAP
jgi:radical SAM protein with 4Fe4S-binding SPASM domain